ncbi:hypothetical protein R0J87_21065, partial [Halomonas sp. SIMBA_159]
IVYQLPEASRLAVHRHNRVFHTGEVVVLDAYHCAHSAVYPAFNSTIIKIVIDVAFAKAKQWQARVYVIPVVMVISNGAVVIIAV